METPTLQSINSLEGSIELLTGLHIGAGSEAIHIGGIDNPIIKHPYTQQPYIPGSSIKGKLRSLLEWRAGLVGFTKGAPVNTSALDKIPTPQQADALAICRLCGVAPSGKTDPWMEKIGPTRASFWDSFPGEQWLLEREEQSQLLTEAKFENSIDRISGTASNPRQTERVPAGAEFNFRVTLKQLDGEDSELLALLLVGLKLLELDGIGGSGSRGYGKICFKNLTLNGECLQARFDNTEPFTQTASA